MTKVLIAKFSRHSYDDFIKATKKGSGSNKKVLEKEAESVGLIMAQLDYPRNRKKIVIRQPSLFGNQ